MRESSQTLIPFFLSTYFFQMENKIPPMNSG
ncbi:unnamed protein product, partial [marine sediment metagenome]